MEEFKRHIESLLNLRNWLGVEVSAKQLPTSERAFFSPIDYAPAQDSLGEPRYEATLDLSFHELAKKQGIRPAPFWPEGRPYALCITHDMDRLLSTIQRAKRLKGKPWEACAAMLRDIPTTWSRRTFPQNAYYPFATLLKLQAELGFRSALYVLFERRRWKMAFAQRELQHAIGVYQPSWIKTELKHFYEQGNEIGIHGSFDSYFDLEALRAEKAELESFGVKAVSGVRNHYLNYREGITPLTQRTAGFLYDSTQGFNFRSGFRVGTCFPYLRDGIWELPFQLMDSALRFQFRTSAERRQSIENVTNTVRQMGGVLVANWHTHTLNPKYFAEEVEQLAQIIRRAKTDGAWIARPTDVIRHWELRAERVAATHTATYSASGAVL
jgi:hypothetical protein